MSSPKEVRLRDYSPPDYLIDFIELDIDIRDNEACVKSRLTIRRNPKSKNKNAVLKLNGETQRLNSICLNGKRLQGLDYKLDKSGLCIPSMPKRAVLELETSHNPYKNTALCGLYASGPMLVTQCEAEGFRHITYYPDRPDVMAKFCVTIHADKKRFPVLLANGNLISKGKENNGRHWVKWEDPHPKPAYLFALVAGNLEKVSDYFKTSSGRRVLIEIYVEPGKKKDTDFALIALKKAMRWDEQRYGLAYDLDRFMMVATPFFNMGAMENKGLNIFNDACVLGKPETATDSTISFIERVVGHEYFHNWTGDRITCRDWFQLSLKEGLTVFREQEFCGDMNSVAVERLGNIRALRRTQFAEDAGPMAHPVRPDHYQAIDNFYTVTVYEKGAEVVRMLQTLVGRKGFRKGMDLYVKRHDGQAVTCEDFVKAMADANKIDLGQFLLWYSQAGTPRLEVSSHYDAKQKTLHLRTKQFCPATPGQPKKKAMHIPFAVGLLDRQGKDLIGTKVLSIKKPQEVFRFNNIHSKPVLSLLRDFSAPIRLEYTFKDEELLFLLACDKDPFNRWEAAQKLYMKYLMFMISAKGKINLPNGLEQFFYALRRLIHDQKLDASFKAIALSPPSETELGLELRMQKKLIDPDLVFATRKSFIKLMAATLNNDLEKIFMSLCNTNSRATDGITMGKRSLKNLSLAYLASSQSKPILKRAYEQAIKGGNMTDQAAALGILSDCNSPLRDKSLEAFEKRWRKYPVIMDKWFAVQASARQQNVLGDVMKLMKHPAFTIKNPNRVSALIGAFAGNPSGFHAKDGSGYQFVTEMIMKIDPLNPQSAAGLAKAFTRWRDYDPKRQAKMRSALSYLAVHKNLSPNCHEIIVKSLKGK